MRVAVVTSSYPQTNDDPSGHFVRAEVDNLVRAGNHVTVFCPGAETALDPNANPVIVHLGADRLFGWPGALSRLNASPWVVWQLVPFVWRARRELRQAPFDRAIAHWLVPCGWPIVSGVPCPTEIVVHGSDARLVARLPRWVRTWLMSSLAARGHQLRFVAPHLRSLVSTPQTEAWLMTSAVAASPLSLPPLPEQTAARAALGLSTEVFVATVIGRLVPNKRVDVALEQAQLPERARVYVIGSGPCLEDLRTRFPNVSFLGQLPRSEALLWLKASNVLLNASQAEGAPTVVREARALNVPVWTAPCEAVVQWAKADPGIRVCPELG